MLPTEPPRWLLRGQTPRRSDRLFSLGLGAFAISVPLSLLLITGACGWLFLPVLRLRRLGDFFVGSVWDPVRERFGALPFIYGTVVVSLLALLLALPVAIGLSIFVTEMITPCMGRLITFLVELLAAIPSVVFGLWGLCVLVPFVRDEIESKLGSRLFSGPPVGLGYLTAGLLLSVMILPTISAVAIAVLRSVPSALREGALALGATQWEMIRLAVIPFAQRGLFSAALLGLVRALGEAMAVTMVIGNQTSLRLSLLAPGCSLPSVLVNEFAEATSSLHIGALAGCALVLVAVTLTCLWAARLLMRPTIERALVGREEGS